MTMLINQNRPNMCARARRLTVQQEDDHVHDVDDGPNPPPLRAHRGLPVTPWCEAATAYVTELRAF